MKAIFDWKGQSLVLNSIFIVVNLIGVTLITMGFHPNFETSLSHYTLNSHFFPGRNLYYYTF